MNRKFAAAIAVACILAALGAAGSIAYRVITESAAGAKVAEADFARLGSTLASVRTASDLADPGLRGSLAAHFSACPNLLAVEIFERGIGTRWRMPADTPYALGESTAGDPPPSSTIRLRAPLGSDSTGALAIDALYVRVTQLSVFTAFRDALIALAAFLALASIALAIASKPRSRAPSREAEEAASAAAAYQYETLSPEWNEPTGEPPPVREASPARESASPREQAVARESARPREQAATRESAPSREQAPAVEEVGLGASFMEYGDRSPDSGLGNDAPAELEELAAPSSEPEVALEPDYLAHAEEAEEDFLISRQRDEAAQEASAKDFFEDDDKSKIEDEFDIPEIDFMEDERPRSTSLEAKLNEPKPDLEMPSDDWMSDISRSDTGSSSPSEAAKPLSALSAGLASSPLDEIEELEAFDLEAAAPAKPEAAGKPAATPARPAAEAARDADITLVAEDDGGKHSPTPFHASGFEPEGRLPGRLATEIFQAASSGKDLSLLLVEHDELTPAVPEYAALAKAVADCFGAGDLDFDRGRNGFAVILPGADSRRAVELANGLYKKLDFLAGGYAGELQFVPLFIGISSRAARPVAADRLIAEADAAIRKAREDMGSHIVAFRPDPERFKDFQDSRKG